MQLLKESPDFFLNVCFIMIKRVKLNLLNVSVKLAEIVEVIHSHLIFVFKVPHLGLRKECMLLVTLYFLVVLLRLTTQ